MSLTHASESNSSHTQEHCSLNTLGASNMRPIYLCIIRNVYPYHIHYPKLHHLNSNLVITLKFFPVKKSLFYRKQTIYLISFPIIIYSKPTP